MDAVDSHAERPPRSVMDVAEHRCEPGVTSARGRLRGRRRGRRRLAPAMLRQVRQARGRNPGDARFVFALQPTFLENFYRRLRDSHLQQVKFHDSAAHFDALIDLHGGQLQFAAADVHRSAADTLAFRRFASIVHQNLRPVITPDRDSCRAIFAAFGAFGLRHRLANKEMLSKLRCDFSSVHGVS